MGRLTLEPFRRAKVRRRARHALAVNPAEFDARVELARDALARGRAGTALPILEPIVARADGAAEVLRLHGLALLGASRAAEAEGAFRAALASDRKERESRLGLAVALAAEERWGEARSEIEAYRSTRPGDARGSWAEAAIRLREGGDGPRARLAPRAGGRATDQAGLRAATGPALGREGAPRAPDAASAGARRRPSRRGLTASTFRGAPTSPTGSPRRGAARRGRTRSRT